MILVCAEALIDLVPVVTNSDLACLPRTGGSTDKVAIGRCAGCGRRAGSARARRASWTGSARPRDQEASPRRPPCRMTKAAGTRRPGSATDEPRSVGWIAGRGSGCADVVRQSEAGGAEVGALGAEPASTAASSAGSVEGGAACSIGPQLEETPTSIAGEPLAIPSIPNLRDVGGCPTRSGGRVRTGLFYRSSGLNALAEADIDALARLVIRTVYDLRMAREQAEAPDRLPAGTRHLPVDVLAGWTDGGPSQLFAWFEDAAAARVGLGGGGAEALWVEQYRAFVRLPSAHAGYGTLFRDLAVEAHRPALVHCATGKDRTGWAAAALQLLLDVPEDAVMDHFLESRRHLGPLVESLLAAVTERGGDPELFRPILDVRPSYLDAALDEVRRGYGTIERYFSDALGVDEATQDAVRTTFTR